MKSTMIEGFSTLMQEYRMTAITDICPGDTVYMPKGNLVGIRKEKVLGISVHFSTLREPSISVVNEQGDMLDTGKIFKTKEELKDYLRDRLERI